MVLTCYFGNSGDSEEDEVEKQQKRWWLSPQTGEDEGDGGSIH